MFTSIGCLTAVFDRDGHLLLAQWSGAEDVGPPSRWRRPPAGVARSGGLPEVLMRPGRTTAPTTEMSAGTRPFHRHGGLRQIGLFGAGLETPFDRDADSPANLNLSSTFRTIRAAFLDRDPAGNGLVLENADVGRPAAMGASVERIGSSWAGAVPAGPSGSRQNC